MASIRRLWLIAPVAPPVPEKLRRAARRWLPPRYLWVYALPGPAAVHQARWNRRLRRAPIVTTEEHAARVGVGPIEEVIGCDLCGDRRVQPLFTPARKRWRYHVVRCPTCGFLYRNPGVKPERLGDLYSSGGYGRFLTGEYERRRRRRYELVLDAFHPAFHEGRGRRLLDYGCGAGQFLELAAARGFETCGVDLAPAAIELARRRPGGANAHLGAPLDVPEIAAGGFDVVTLWSVAAHLATPVEDLRTLRGLLAPGGVVLVLTVNANSLVLKAEGDAWGGFTPNHLKFFSPLTLPLWLSRAGFGASVVRATYTDGVEDGTVPLRPSAERRLRRTIDAGNRGNMLRALGFASPDGPARWGLDAGATQPPAPAPAPAG